MNKFSILFLGTQMEVAGAQRVLLSQARWFHEQGYSVQAVFFYDKQRLQKNWQSANPFPIISLYGWKANTFPLFNIFNLAGALSKLFSLLRKDVKAVIAFTPHSNLLGLPIAWLARVPVRVGTHHGYIEGSSNTMAWLHGRLTNSRFVSGMVAVSAQVRDYALKREKALPERLVVIENGIEPLAKNFLEPVRRQAIRSELGVPENGLLLLTVGRLTVQKGHTILLEAIAQISQSNFNVRFAFAGEGPQRAALEAQIAVLGIADKVVLLGVRDDISDLLLSADVFVQPSLWEGLSLALLEALQAGLAVLATRVEGVVDVVENGQSALLVPPNDVSALAEALERIIQDADLRKRIGQAGQERVEKHYSIETMCRSYEVLLQKLLNAN